MKGKRKFNKFKFFNKICKFSRGETIEKSYKNSIFIFMFVLFYGPY